MLHTHMFEDLQIDASKDVAVPYWPRGKSFLFALGHLRFGLL